MVHPYAAEVTFVLENQRVFVLAQDEVIVFAALVARVGFVAEFTIHAEVDPKPQIATESEKHLLAASFRVDEALAWQETMERGGVRISEDAEIRTSDDYFTDDFATSEVPPTAAVFDFSEFRHKRKQKM